MSKSSAFLTVTLTVFLTNCQVIDNNSQEQHQARIVFGESIDGIKIGLDTTAVVQQLGRPHEIAIGDFPGVAYLYTSGKYEGLSLAIWTETMQGVQSVSIAAPYEGKSADGVGIGSSREAVLQLLGLPDSSGAGAAADRLVDLYLFEEIKFGIVYQTGVIRSIAMSGR